MSCRAQRRGCGTIAPSSAEAQQSPTAPWRRFYRESQMSNPLAKLKWTDKARVYVPSGRFFQGPFAHLGLSETQRFLILALFIGMFSGLLVVLFHITIDWISWMSLGALAGRFQFVRLLSP